MKATDRLLADHKMIRKILTNYHLDHPRFTEVFKTLERSVLGHAWFEDQIFLPAFDAEPRVHRRYIEEIYQEHKDLDVFLKLLRGTPVADKELYLDYALQLRAVLETHLKKEEDALFPLAEKYFDPESLVHMAKEMERRKTEIWTVFPTWKEDL